MREGRALFWPGGAALAALSLLACSGSAPPRQARATYSIVMKDMAFSPPPANLHIGDTIEWVNEDIFVHTATAQEGGFDVEVKPNDKARMTLSKAGRIAFYCRFHPGMKGALDVAG